MGSAVDIQRGSFRIVTKSDCAVLMRDARERNSLPDEKISREQALMTRVAVDRTRALALQEFLKFCGQPPMTLDVVRLVGQDDVAVAIENRNAARLDRRDVHCSASNNFREFLVSWHNLLAGSACRGISPVKGFQLRNGLALLHDNDLSVVAKSLGNFHELDLRRNCTG